MRKERVFFAVLFIAIAVLALMVILPFLSYILLAAILTFVLFPIYRFLLKRTRRAGLSSALSILIALLVMVLPAVYFVSALVEQVSGAYTLFRTENISIQRVDDYLSGLTGNRIKFRGPIDSGLEQIRRSMVGIAPNILGSITGLVIGLFIMFSVMFYGFCEGEDFVRHIKQLLPLDPGLKDSLFDEVRTITQAVLYGQVMTAIIQGGVGGLGLLVFGVSNWIFWGSMMILTAFIPVLGTPLIWLPASVGLLLQGETTRGIGLLIFGAAIVMNIDNFIRPRLVSGRTKVHPILILIGVLGGLKLFGFVGMLIGPLVLALLVALIKFYEDAYPRKSAPPSLES